MKYMLTINVITIEMRMKASSFCYLWEQVMFERFLKFQEPLCMINKNFFPPSCLYTFKSYDHWCVPVLSCWMHYKIYATLSEELPVWKQFHFLCQDISSQLLHLIPLPHKMTSSLVQKQCISTRVVPFPVNRTLRFCRFFPLVNNTF